MWSLRITVLLLGLLLCLVPVHAADDDQGTSAARDWEEGDASLPRAGNLSDVLRCAGANEVLWTTGLRENPYSHEAHEAKRKAGWYAAVALYVFEAEGLAVADAVSAASKHDSREEIFQLARRCRKPLSRGTQISPPMGNENSPPHGYDVGSSERMSPALSFSLSR